MSHYASDEGTSGSETELDSGEEDFEDYAVKKEAVIIFIDVDSFDVQVRGRDEGIAMGTLKTKPFVVVNDANVITAVNYPAKDLGIRRVKECTLDVAKQLCQAKNVTLNVLRIPDHYGKPDALSPRKASDEILEILVTSLQNWCGGRPVPKIERASKDEFYIDVTNEIFHRVHRKMMVVPSHQEVQVLKETRCFMEAPKGQVKGNRLSYRTLQVLTNPNIVKERHVTEAFLMHGAVIAHAILEDIMDETGFTLSAGVSSNKLLAKLGCGYNKPDSITVLPHASLGRVAKKIKVEDIPGLGGKLGKTLKEKLRVETMSHLSHKHRTILQRIMGGEHAIRYNQLAQGFDPSKVVSKKFSSKLSCGITFNYRTRRMYKPEDFLGHLRNRFLEMKDHLIYECAHNGPGRIPKSFRLEVRTRKRNLKVAYGETIDLNGGMANCIANEAKSLNNNQASLSSGSKLLSEKWAMLVQQFIDGVQEDCKIDILDETNYQAACAAVRKVSEINLIANFTPVADDEN